jgi:tetratricopeptide (TPR) repeat protein
MARVTRIAAATIIAMTMAVITTPGIAGAQTRPRTSARDTPLATSLPARCGSISAPRSRVAARDAAAAREIAARAQTSSIVGDNAAAMTLYQKAAQLNPTDASIAYALGREYEAARDTRAMGEYCRFLALTPEAPEAADVRQRIAQLALALPPDTTVVRIPVSAPARMPAPGAALGAGLIIPGMGQFTTHRPAAGLLVMAVTGAAAYYGLQSQKVPRQVTNTGTDPFGNPYQYQTTVTRTERPHAAVGIGAAAGVTLLAAIEAFAHARTNRADARSERGVTANTSTSIAATPLVTLAPHSMGIGLTLQ